MTVKWVVLAVVIFAVVLATAMTTTQHPRTCFDGYNASTPAACNGHGGTR